MNHASDQPRALSASCPAPAVDSGDARGFDVMRLGLVRRVVRWGGFPRVFQGMMLVVLLGLVVVAWGRFTPAGINDKLYAKTNLATLLVWGLWWPAMVWTAVWLGRVWCMVCPLELLGRGGERLAGFLPWRARPLPRWLATGGAIVALYLGLQVLVPGIHLHRVPAFTAYFLTSLVGLAVLVGVAFRDRAICRGFCPVGLLLGTYGRGAILAVRGGRVEGAPRSDASGTLPCPSLLNPPRLNSNAACLGCLHCFKHATPGTMRLLLRRPFPASDTREALASWPVTGFVMIASGFVLSELCSEWPAAKKLFLATPEAMAAMLGLKAWGGWIEALWTLLIVPLALWLLLAGLLRLAGGRGSWAHLMRRLALPVAVVVSAGHLSKALAKFASWVQFLPGAWQDPSGRETARAITEKVLPAPAPVMSLGTISWISLGLILIAAVVAVREYRLAQQVREKLPHGAWPIAFLAAGFAVIVAGWR